MLNNWKPIPIGMNSLILLIQERKKKKKQEDVKICNILTSLGKAVEQVGTVVRIKFALVTAPNAPPPSPFSFTFSCYIIIWDYVCT